MLKDKIIDFKRNDLRYQDLFSDMLNPFVKKKSQAKDKEILIWTH